MKAPTCKLCGGQHYTYQPHQFGPSKPSTPPKPKLRTTPPKKTMTPAERKFANAAYMRFYRSGGRLRQKSA